ncbi:MAG TPA: hypothetical protein VEQ41_01290 [Solirubrobacterales bacterium]|nr:hypothetical protein [Solirubrobacterales bacterium]
MPPHEHFPPSDQKTNDHGAGHHRCGKPFEQCRSGANVRENEHAPMLHRANARVARKSQILRGTFAPKE